MDAVADRVRAQSFTRIVVACARRGADEFHGYLGSSEFLGFIGRSRLFFILLCVHWRRRKFRRRGRERLMGRRRDGDVDADQCAVNE